MNKRKLLKRQKNKNDTLWKEGVKSRDKVCQICGRDSGHLAAHHIIPREFKESRWDLENGMLLCSMCHRWGKFSAHKNSLWFYDWLKLNRPKTFDHCMIILQETLITAS